MKAVRYDSNPASHHAEVRVIELASATSLAEFLLALLLSFIIALARCGTLGKDYHSISKDSNLPISK